jgi:hypothetical protein
MFELLLPPVNSKLHSHNKGHWGAKLVAVKELKELAEALTMQWFAAQGRRQKWPAAFVSYRFFVPDLRRRDTANMIQSTKPAIDGVVAAGLIPDDDWKHLRIKDVEVKLDRKNPRVVLVFMASRELREESMK